jgi:hypothetical protein
LRTIPRGGKPARYSHKPQTVHTSRGNRTIPEGLNPDTILDRFLSEETTTSIAEEYGLTQAALTKWLKAERPKEWKEAQTVRALCRKDKGDDGLGVACDALALARARELLKSGQWDLERLDSANYGPKQEVKITAEVKMESVLEGHCERILKLIGATQQPSQVIDVPSDALQQVETIKP